MKRCFFILVFFCLGGVALAAAPVKKPDATPAPATIPAPKVPKKKVFNTETFTLDNGLQIIVIPDHRAPVMTHMIWYKVGAAEENPGKSGVAHFLEHLMFKGSKGLLPGEFSRKIRAVGGDENAFTGHDYTAFFQSLSVDNLEIVMTMEAGRMRGLNPPLEHVESERKVILEERRERTDNNPHARLAEQMNALLYVNHPYGKPVIGWAHEMATLTWPDEKAFYDKWYAPNNAILIVAGDVTGQQVYDLAKKIYGPIPKSDIPPRVRTTSPPLHGTPEVILKDATIREPVVEKIYRAPSAHQNQKESLALEVLSNIMGEGSTSRLYKALVVDQKIATSAGLSYGAESWDDSETWVYATPTPGVDLKKLRDALDVQLRLLVEKGVTPEELNAAKTRMEADAVYARDSLTEPAMVFGYALTTGESVDDVEYWPYNIAQVTAQDIQDAAKKYLNPDAAFDHSPVTGYLEPETPEQLTQTAKPHAAPTIDAGALR